MKLFGKKKREEYPNLEPVTVEEIHQDFKSASELMQNELDIWLNVTKNFIEEEKKKDVKLKEKSLNLQKLGFFQTPDVVKLREEQEKMNKIMEDVKEKEKVLQLVQHYKLHYPQHKFVTKEIVESLCQKYNLWCVPVTSYTGSVPDNCVEEMINFKVRVDDLIIESRYNSFRDDWDESPFAPESVLEYFRKEPNINGCNKDDKRYRVNDQKMICCPKSNVNQTSLERDKHYSPEKKEWFRPEPKDPIVLTPVKGGYLIITAWGPEAQDPEVFNENKN